MKTLTSLGRDSQEKEDLEKWEEVLDRGLGRDGQEKESAYRNLPTNHPINLHSAYTNLQPNHPTCIVHIETYQPTIQPA